MRRLALMLAIAAGGTGCSCSPPPTAPPPPPVMSDPQFLEACSQYKFAPWPAPADFVDACNRHVFILPITEGQP